MHELPDRFGPAWGLVMLTAAIAAVILLGRVLGRRGGASKAPPVALPEGGEEGEPEPVCRARGCLAPATRGIPEARPWRPVSWLLPRWEVVTDAEAEPALCAAHHGPLASALTARAAQERAALEEHLAARPVPSRRGRQATRTNGPRRSARRACDGAHSRRGRRARRHRGPPQGGARGRRRNDLPQRRHRAAGAGVHRARRQAPNVNRHINTRGPVRQRELAALADPETHPSVVAHRRLVARIRGML